LRTGIPRARENGTIGRRPRGQPAGGETPCATVRLSPAVGKTAGADDPFAPRNAGTIEGKIPFRSVAFLILLASVLGPIRSSRAEFPLATEDAKTLGRGNIEVEFDFEQSSGGREERTTTLENAYTLGVADRIDFAATFAYLFHTDEDGSESVRGISDTEVTLKMSFSGGTGWIPTAAIQAGALLPTGKETKGLGDGRASGLFTVIADWEMGTVLVHANTGMTIAGRPVGSQDRDDSLSASAAVEWKVHPRTVLLGEYLWEKNTGASGAASSELFLGGRMQISRSLSLGTGIRWGTTDASPNVTYLAGITYFFPWGENGEGPHQDAQDAATELGGEAR